jgi:hypothetical protein
MKRAELEALDQIADLAHEGHDAGRDSEFPARLCRREVCLQIQRLRTGDWDGVS